MKCKLQSTHIIYQSIALEVLILINIITPFSFFVHLVWFSYDTSHIIKLQQFLYDFFVFVAGVPVNVMEVLYPPHEDSPEYQVLIQNLKVCLAS